MASALTLHRRGLRPLVLERAPALAEIGAGLQVTPNGMAVLRGLGLDALVARRGVPAEAVEPHDALTGRRLARFPVPSPGRWVFIRRTALLDVLARAMDEAGLPLRTGTPVDSSVPGAVVTAGGERLAAPLVVGADGIRSVLRAGLLTEAGPTFAGQVAWRALVRAPHDPVARIWMAPGRHVVTYPLGEGWTNLVAVREERGWAEEGWHLRDSPDALRAAFADVAPPLAAILARVEETGRWGLFRRPVPLRWHDATRVLVGDAAHPTLPFLAQGANLALEDAWVLAREVGRGGRLDEALARYQAQRRPRVVRAVAAADANARNYHLRGLSRRAAALALTAVGLVAPAAFLRRYAWLHGHDVTAAG
nr:FAD-dependent monooxygenase [Rubellimicrobium sp. CFH 75288]